MPSLCLDILFVLSRSE